MLDKFENYLMNSKIGQESFNIYFDVKELLQNQSELLQNQSKEIKLLQNELREETL